MPIPVVAGLATLSLSSSAGAGARALRYRRAWVGRIRAVLKDAQGDLISLTAYNTKHPTYGFLTGTDLTNINNAILTIEDKLAQTRLS